MHYEYGGKKGSYSSIHHRVSYLMRSPVGDVYRLVTQAVSPVAVEKAWASRLLVRPKGKKNFQGFGWWAPCVRNKYLVRTVFPSEKVCPVSGCGHGWHVGRCSHSETSLERVRVSGGRYDTVKRGVYGRCVS